MRANSQIIWIWAAFLICTSIMPLTFAEDIPTGIPNRADNNRKVDELNTSLKAKPDSFTEQVNYARKLYELGDMEQASKILALVLDGVDDKVGSVSEAMFLSASIAYLTGDYEQAEERYLAVLNTPVDSFSARAKVGLLHTYFQTNQFHKAGDLYSDTEENNGVHEERETSNPKSMWNMMRSFAENEPYRIAWHDSDNQAVMPFISSSPLPVIEAVVND